MPSVVLECLSEENLPLMSMIAKVYGTIAKPTSNYVAIVQSMSVGL